MFHPVNHVLLSESEDKVAKTNCRSLSQYENESISIEISFKIEV